MTQFETITSTELGATPASGSINSKGTKLDLNALFLRKIAQVAPILYLPLPAAYIIPFRNPHLLTFIHSSESSVTMPPISTVLFFFPFSFLSLSYFHFLDHYYFHHTSLTKSPPGVPFMAPLLGMLWAPLGKAQIKRRRMKWNWNVLIPFSLLN